MPNILLSGPAGAGKSQEALRLRREALGPAIIADFQSIYAALAGDVRGPDGRFPLRDDRLLPIVEYVRRGMIGSAVDREIEVIATNSDGNPTRRARLLELLGPGSKEIVVDPGRKVVEGRLSDPVTGLLRSGCEGAVARWYDRIGGQPSPRRRR